MLEKCAPGFTIEDKTHLRWIRYGGKCARVPQGPHGSGENYEIKIGQVRGLVNQLEIDMECAKAHLPQLR